MIDLNEAETDPGTPPQRRREGAAILTERDKNLLGILARARYLTTEQIARLMFPGRSEWVVRRRLGALSGEWVSRARLDPPVVQRTQWRLHGGGFQTAWSLTPLGYAHAEGVLGVTVKPSRHHVGADFMAHEVATSELYVRLLLALNRGRLPTDKQRELKRRQFALARHPGLGWVGSDAARYPWREYQLLEARTKEHVIQPDAVLELASVRRRIFIECEMGTHPVASANVERSGATVAKVERYDAFIHGLRSAPESR